jgi:hypothetical protein
VELAEFQKSLRQGSGRAILYARGHDVREFHDVILDACLHCYAYEGRLYGTHASYMHDLVGCLPDKGFYHSEVLKSLPGSGDNDDALQRFEFAACLASDGNGEARQTMYASYNPGPRMGESIGAEFLQLDGMNGLLFAAEKIGALLLENAEEVNLGFLVSRSIDICGEETTWEALREAGTANPRIEAYRLAAEASEHRIREFRPRQDFSTLKYERLFQEVPLNSLNSRISFFQWGVQANEEELMLAAEGLIAAGDSQQRLAHLYIFRGRGFPLNVNVLLDLVDAGEDRVGRAAVKALACITHPAVRDLGFRLVETRARWRGEAIDLIAQNFRPGDHRIVLRWFAEEEDGETRHSLGLDLIDFWERHPDEETKLAMLLAMYEKGWCSFCRERAVRRLIELDALSEEMRAECAWDANDDIRNLAIVGDDRS